MDTLARLKKLFTEMSEGGFDVSGVTAATSLTEELGFTSLNLLWMAFAIEQEFGVDISTLRVGELHTVGDVIRFIDAAMPK